jgi:hypothetical protein
MACVGPLAKDAAGARVESTLVNVGGSIERTSGPARFRRKEEFIARSF